MAVAHGGQPGPSLKAGAIVEGALLAGTLAALVAAFFLVHPAGRDGASDGDSNGAAPARIVATTRVEHPDTYLVLVVSERATLTEAMPFTRDLDAGASWVVGVDVVDAGDRTLEMYRSLQTSLAFEPCPEACPEVAIVDLH
jgi:hypothetical protein